MMLLALNEHLNASLVALAIHVSQLERIKVWKIFGHWRLGSRPLGVI